MVNGCNQFCAVLAKDAQFLRRVVTGKERVSHQLQTVARLFHAACVSEHGEHGLCGHVSTVFFHQFGKGVILAVNRQRGRLPPVILKAGVIYPAGDDAHSAVIALLAVAGICVIEFVQAACLLACKACEGGDARNGLLLALRRKILKGDIDVGFLGELSEASVGNAVADKNSD